ncbi:hypothetical protein EDB85DRAFT_1896772 [Lactarius pseudohatsudake]|nr:hypothetical protein EDB85DRAFT_1896772 [Lactarius pseudohatsudake]
MKKIADVHFCWKKDVDLLLVNFGDLHDELGFDRAQSNQFFSQLPYDVLAIGNHELYIYANALDMHQDFAPKFPGRYLSSNVNITILGPNGSPVGVPVGSRFAKFNTRKGRKVTSLGVLYNFTETITIKGGRHGERSLARDNFCLNTDDADSESRRAHAYPRLPAVRWAFDCSQEAGGTWKPLRRGLSLGVDLDHRGSKWNLTVNCRYLDPNRVIYEGWNRPALALFPKPIARQYHTNQIAAIRRKITKGLEALAARFDLDFKFGTAPRDYTLSRDPFPSNDSLLSPIADQVLPTALNNTRANIPNTIIANLGSLRFDIYAGPFTKNDQLAASPFTDVFVFIARPLKRRKRGPARVER